MSGSAGNAYLRFGRALGKTKAGVYFFRHVYDPIDRWLYRRSGGRRGLAPSKMPVLILTTRGRKTGNACVNPVLYLEDDGRYVVVGSNYGRQRHPAWTYNLLAEPRCRIQMGEVAREATGRPATDAEVEELWPRLLAVWPGWTTYQRMTDREFRIFYLEPDPA